MSLKENPCIICCKMIHDSEKSNIPLSNDKGEFGNPTRDEGELLTRFFHLLDRYLDNPRFGMNADTKETIRFPFDKIIQAGLLACSECTILVESFCDLYHQMKSIQLMLNWKLKSLKDVMLRAQRYPSRIASFRNCIKQMEIGNTGDDDIIPIKQELIKKCFRKLSSVTPQVKVRKLPQDKAAYENIDQPNKDSPQNSKRKQPLLESNDDHDNGDQENIPVDKILSPLKSQNDMEKPLLESNDPLKSETYKCSSCQKQFGRKDYLLCHYSNAHLQLRFDCGQCDKKFSYWESYKIHHRKEHLPKGRFRCRLCNEAFPRGSDLRKHQQRIPKCIAKFKKPNSKCEKVKKKRSGKGNAGEKEVPEVSSGDMLEEENLHVRNLDFTLKKKTAVGTTLLFHIRKQRPPSNFQRKKF